MTHPSTDRPFLFNVVVWGESYVRKFLDYTLPTLLAPRNIPSLCAVRDCEFLIVTTALDIEILKASPLVAKLNKVMPVTFLPYEFSAHPGDKYHRMTHGHRLVCEYGKAKRAYGVFLMPEMLMGNGTMLHLHKLVRHGAQAVIMMVLRLIEEEVEKLRGLPVLEIPNRDLVRFLFSYAHHEIRTFMVDAEEFSNHPGYVIWPTEKQAWIVCGLHAQPMLVDLAEAQPDAIGHTIDAGEFVGACVPDREAIEVVADSDLAMICSLTPKNDIPTAHNWAAPTSDTVRGFVNSTPLVTALNRWYFEHPVILHSGVMPELSAELAETAGFVQRVLA